MILNECLVSRWEKRTQEMVYPPRFGYSITQCLCICALCMHRTKLLANHDSEKAAKEKPLLHSFLFQRNKTSSPAAIHMP